MWLKVLSSMIWLLVLLFFWEINVIAPTKGVRRRRRRRRSNYDDVRDLGRRWQTKMAWRRWQGFFGKEGGMSSKEGWLKTSMNWSVEMLPFAMLTRQGRVWSSSGAWQRVSVGRKSLVYLKVINFILVGVFCFFIKTIKFGFEIL